MTDHPTTGPYQSFLFSQKGKNNNLLMLSPLVQLINRSSTAAIYSTTGHPNNLFCPKNGNVLRNQKQIINIWQTPWTPLPLPPPPSLRQQGPPQTTPDSNAFHLSGPLVMHIYPPRVLLWSHPLREFSLFPKI